VADTTTRDPKAPHGYDADGQPLAPYGYKVDGTPRLSKRGARPGQRGNKGPASAKSAAKETAAKRRDMLIGLADMLIVTPLAGASASPFLAKRIGPKQADALAGDAVIVSHFAPSLADGLLVLGETKPGAIAWLDSVEDKAPYLMLAQVGVQMVKAFVGNHMNPDPRLAEAGRTLVQMRAAQMAQAIEDEAAAMGIPTSVPAPEQAPRAA
jgi:hypothetical protein